MKKFYNFYKISRKLRLLMVLEILLLTVSFILILFFYMQNYTTQQSNTIYHMNQSLLIQTNSVIEKMDNSLDFPLAHIADRYDDPLLRYLIEHDHGDISETDFYRVFAIRVSEVSIQIPDLESLFLFDTDGNLLNGKIIYYRYIPLKNYSDGSWYQNTIQGAGKIHILSKEEIDYFGLRNTSQNIYGARLLYDYLTLKPICMTLMSIRATNIPVTFETTKEFGEQQYALFDSSGQKLIGNMQSSITQDSLSRSSRGDYHFSRKEEDGESYLYHVSYSSESDGLYSVIRTPYRLFIRNQFRAVCIFIIAGVLLIVLDIITFTVIIRSINQPLSRMINMCEEIGKGNFSIRIPCSQTDELSYLMSSLNSMSERIEQLINEVYVKNLTKRDLELQMLRSQINPHFLYNTLENMRMSAYTQGYTDLSEMCFLLSKVLRYGVSERDKLVTVREELEQLKNYTDLLHYCLPALQIFVFVDDQIMDYSIIKVILQPLVENSVNHASRSPDATLTIQIWGYADENDIVFTVSDNGDGIEETYLQELIHSLDAENDTRHGIGLKNIHRRIRLYYGPDYGLTLQSSPRRGTSVTVRIPKVQNQKEIVCL